MDSSNRWQALRGKNTSFSLQQRCKWARQPRKSASDLRHHVSFTSVHARGSVCAVSHLSSVPISKEMRWHLKVFVGLREEIQKANRNLVAPHVLLRMTTSQRLSTGRNLAQQM